MSQPAFQKQKNELYDQNLSCPQQQYGQNHENDFRMNGSQKLEIQPKNLRVMSQIQQQQNLLQSSRFQNSQLQYQNDIDYRSDDEQYQDQGYQDHTNQFNFSKINYENIYCPEYQLRYDEQQDESINHIHTNKLNQGELLSQQSDGEEDFNYHQIRGSLRRSNINNSKFLNENNPIQRNNFDQQQNIYNQNHLQKKETTFPVNEQRQFNQHQNIRAHNNRNKFDRGRYQELDYDDEQQNIQQIDRSDYDHKQMKMPEGIYKQSQQQFYENNHVKKTDDLILEQNSSNQANQQQKKKNYNAIAGSLFNINQDQKLKNSEQIKVAEAKQEDEDFKDNIKKQKIQEVQSKIGGKLNSTHINKKAEDLFKNTPQIQVSQKNLIDQQATISDQQQKQLSESPQKKDTQLQKKQEASKSTNFKKQISEKQPKLLKNQKEKPQQNQKHFQSDEENQLSPNKNEDRGSIKKVTKDGVKKLKQGYQQKGLQNSSSYSKNQQTPQPKPSELEPPKKKGSNQYTAKYAQSAQVQQIPEPISPNISNQKSKKEDNEKTKNDKQIVMIATRSKRTLSQNLNKNVSQILKQTKVSSKPEEIEKEDTNTPFQRQLRSRKINAEDTEKPRTSPKNTRKQDTSQVSQNNNQADKSKRSAFLQKDETEIRYILEQYFEYLCNEFLPPRKISEITVGHIFQKKSYEQDKKIEFSVTNICLTQFSGNKKVQNLRSDDDDSQDEDVNTGRRRNTKSKDGYPIKNGMPSKKRDLLETPTKKSQNTGSNNVQSGSYNTTPNVSQIKSSRRRAADVQSYGKNFRIGDIIDFTQQKKKDLANLYLIKDIKISLDYSGESEKKIEKQNEELPDVLIQFTVFPIVQYYTKDAFPQAQIAMNEIQKHLDQDFKFDKNSNLGLIEVNKAKTIVDERLDFEKIILNFTQVQKSYAVKIENDGMNTINKFKTCRETNRHNNSNNYDREYILEYVYQHEKPTKISVFKPFYYRDCENPKEFDFIQQEYVRLKSDRDWSSDKRKKGGYGERDHSNQSFKNTSRSPAEREVSQASKQSHYSRKSDGVERAKMIQMKQELEQKYKQLNIKPVMSNGIIKQDNCQKKANSKVESKDLSEESSEKSLEKAKEQRQETQSQNSKISLKSNSENQNLRKSRRLREKQNKDPEQKTRSNIVQERFIKKTKENESDDSSKNRSNQVKIEIQKNQLIPSLERDSSSHSQNSNRTQFTNITRIIKQGASMSQMKRADKLKKFKKTTRTTIIETDRELLQSSQKKEDVKMQNQDLTESEHSDQKIIEKSSDEPNLKRRRQQKGLPSSQTSHAIKSSSSLQPRMVKRSNSDIIMEDIDSQEIMSDISKGKSISSMKLLPLNKIKPQQDEIQDLKNDYDNACHNLLLSSLPKNLPCREQEQQRIINFIREGVENKGSSTTLYISGMPGTGKTATTLQVIFNLKIESERSKALQDFDFIHINGMSLTNPLTVYTILAEKITGVRMSPSIAVVFLDDFFKKKDKKQILLKCLCKSGKPNSSLNKQVEHMANKVRVVLIDELDGLMTAKQSLFYNLAEWPCIQNSHLIVISIANTMDLPEKLQSKIRSRMGDNRLVYEPYNQQQIETIIQARLAGNNIFDQKSIQLISKKVASFSGDIRRSLQIARRAVEITRDQYNMNPSGELKRVTTNEILLASDEMTNSNVVLIMRDLRNLEVVILIALFLENKNKQVPSLDQVFDRSKMIIQGLDWQDIFFTQQMFRESIKRLQTFGLVNLMIDNNRASVSHEGFYDFVDLQGAYKNHEVYLSEKNNVCNAEKINTN